MAIIDKIKKGWDAFTAKEIRMFNAGEISPIKNMPYLYNWFWAAELGLPRGVDIAELRQYGKSVWPQMVFSAIKKQLMTTNWDIITDDEEDETDYSEDILKVKTLLNQPNRNGETFWDVWGKFTHDVLEIDAGVVWKGRNSKGEIVELYTYDGSRFLADVEEHGLIRGYYQYSFRHPGVTPKWFDKDELVYGKMGVNTETFPYGWSPLQSVVQEIEVLIQSTRYNKEFFKNNAVPDGIVSLETDKDGLDRFKFQWLKEVVGRAHKLVFHNAPATFTPIAINNKDMEWLEGQKWYFHTVFAAYGLSPQEVGFYENSNRSTGESQERVSIKNAIKPYLQLIEDKINRDIIYEVVGHDKIKFSWFAKDDVAEKVEHDQVMAKLQANVLTINEVRKKEGLKPVEWGDKPFSMVLQNEFGSNDTQDESGKDVPNRKDKVDEDEKIEPDETKKLYQSLLKGFVNNGN